MTTFAFFPATRLLQVVVLLSSLAACIKTNTVTKTVTVTDTLVIARDTARGDITLIPTGGDDYPQLQKTIDYCLSNPGHRILLVPGHYPISHPLLVVKKSGNDYTQVTIDIMGAMNAKDAADPFCSVIIPQFTNGFAIGIQQGKGCTISNIKFSGKYGLPQRLGLVQIDSLSWQGWSDGICSDGRTNPYSAIAIDPFSDPGDYTSDTSLYQKYKGLDTFYLPGMRRSGSTAINITGCSIQGFVVGVMVTPSYQQNGDLINVLDSRIDFCKVCYAYSQAQSKGNQLNDLMVWGHVHTVVDGLHFGFLHSDGSTAPFINVMNIAGGVYELINASTAAYPVSMTNVYAEQLFKLGEIGGRAETYFNSLEVNFQLAAGLPSPDFYFVGSNVIFTGCMLRVYNGQTKFNRITLNSPGTVFNGGLFSSPPVAVSGEGFTPGPTFNSVNLYYTGGVLNNNNYDSVCALASPLLLSVDRSTYSGYFTAANAATFAPGDVLFTAKQNEGGGVAPVTLPVMNYQYPLGFVSAVGSDTVYLQNVGVGIRDNTAYKVWIDRVKKN
jgi:hypothetical protein